MPFSPVRFSAYARDLADAVYGLSWECRQKENASMAINPLDRLKVKLAKASGVSQRTLASIEAKADALIAREEPLKAKTEQAFQPHEQILDQTERHLDDIENALDLMSNGGPALDDDQPSATPLPTVRGYPQ
jgi:hypothetical protein